MVKGECSTVFILPPPRGSDAREGALHNPAPRSARGTGRVQTMGGRGGGRDKRHRDRSKPEATDDLGLL
jgi:hypothetical protein